MRIVDQKAEVIEAEPKPALYVKVGWKEFAFDIQGEPRPAKSTEINRKTGAVYRPKAHKVTVANVADSAKYALERAGVNHTPVFSAGKPLRLHVVFYFPYLKAHYETKRGFEGELKRPIPIWVIKKVDIDNMLKPLKDGMKGSIYADDSQVVSYGTVDKCYDFHGHTQVRVESIY